MTEFLLHAPLDMHLHLRESDMLEAIGHPSCRSLSGAVVMPNLRQPVDTVDKVRAYRQAIRNAVRDESFTPYMTLFFRPYTPKELDDAKEHILGIKLYPAGITTGSEQGVTSIRDCESTFAAMEERGIPLLVHGESNGFVLDREEEFIKTYDWLARQFPELHIVMEHITTEAAVRFLDRFENVSATVTLHHLMITLDDLMGGLLRPHLFCKPVAKRPADRDAIREAVFGGHPRIMYGSDSAPHPRDQKEACGCAAGIFTAPDALPLLAQIFEEAGKLDRLQGFVSDIARNRYSLTPPEKTIRLIRKEYRIPATYADVVPFLAGQTIRWSLAKNSPKS